MVPVRVIEERFAATLNNTAPFPVVPGDVTLIQLTDDVAVQAHPEVTLKVDAPPPGPNDPVVGESAYVHAAPAG
jgi:hypothetical protein